MTPVKVYMTATLRVYFEDLRTYDGRVPQHMLVSRMAEYLGPEWHLGCINENFADETLDIEWIRANPIEDNL